MTTPSNITQKNYAEIKMQRNQLFFIASISSASLLPEMDWGFPFFFILARLHHISYITTEHCSTSLFSLGKKNKLGKGDVFIVSLAIADLIACVIWPVHMITYHSFFHSKWFFEPSTQSAFFFIFYTTLMISSWQLLLISIDRYW